MKKTNINLVNKTEQSQDGDQNFEVWHLKPSPKSRSKDIRQEEWDKKSKSKIKTVQVKYKVIALENNSKQ